MNLTIDRCGDGPDLALIHGWGIGAAAWDDLLPLLTMQLRVHVVTLPGYPCANASAADRMQRLSWPGTHQDPHGSTVSEEPAGKAPPDALSRPSPAGSSAQNPPDFVDTAAAIADALPAGCALCGWSLGGLLALQAALPALAPKRIDRLILCAATPAFIHSMVLMWASRPNETRSRIFGSILPMQIGTPTLGEYPPTRAPMFNWTRSPF